MSYLLKAKILNAADFKNIIGYLSGTLNDIEFKFTESGMYIDAVDNDDNLNLIRIARADFEKYSIDSDKCFSINSKYLAKKLKMITAKHSLTMLISKSSPKFISFNVKEIKKDQLILSESIEIRNCQDKIISEIGAYTKELTFPNKEFRVITGLKEAGPITKLERITKYKIKFTSQGNGDDITKFFLYANKPEDDDEDDFDEDSEVEKVIPTSYIKKLTKCASIGGTTRIGLDKNLPVMFNVTVGIIKLFVYIEDISEQEETNEEYKEEEYTEE